MSDKKIEDAIDTLNEKYGENSIVRATDEKKFDIDVLPTGCLSLDYVFGCGGLPRGRVIEIHGLPSSSKTSTAYYLAGRVQKAGGVVVWVDAEICHNAAYASSMGVDTNKLIVSQPSYGEEALDIVDKMVKAGVDLIVVDSVSALSPKKELEGEIEDQQMALQARMLSKGLRMITASQGKSKTTVIWINQLREVIGGFGFGPRKVTSGGNALRFYASVRLEVTKIKQIKDKSEQTIGNVIRITAVKNKCAIPFKEAEIEFIYGKGFSMEDEILKFGEMTGVITKAGNTLTYDTIKLGVGVEQSKKMLEGDDKLKEKIKKDIEKKLK